MQAETGKAPQAIEAATTDRGADRDIGHANFSRAIRLRFSNLKKDMDAS